LPYLLLGFGWVVLAKTPPDSKVFLIHFPHFFTKYIQASSKISWANIK